MVGRSGNEKRSIGKVRWKWEGSARSCAGEGMRGEELGTWGRERKGADERSAVATSRLGEREKEGEAGLGRLGERL